LAEARHPLTIHAISAEHAASVWDNQAAPALEIASGETVALECREASDGQLGPDSTAADIARVEWDRCNPVTGPVFVKDAKPGGVLQVDILELAPQDWGWTAIFPEFGLLTDEFPDPWLRISSVDAAAGTVRFAPDITLPFAPFPGTIGVAPAEPGPHPVLPPSRWGGNVDIRQLVPGTTLYLPVGVEGALFSVGDTHAAQGDGEVCGTAIETPMTITVRLTARTDLPAMPFPQYHVPRAVVDEREGTRGGYHATTGIGPDLYTAAQDAVRALVDHIVDRHGRDRQEAYALTSVAADLRIHEIVDAPNWTVGALLPDAVFDTDAH